jgi:hypothetical protein
MPEVRQNDLPIKALERERSRRHFPLVDLAPAFKIAIVKNITTITSENERSAWP